ncbi:hypothetical protein [Amycolatopsis sp. cmx-4-68]|uniref:hypothetical protein n=1 Tax=Amycolatopsis sp. cmx-4-68 TaxID=2790938 RepID=UPI00397BE492
MKMRIDFMTVRLITWYCFSVIFGIFPIFIAVGSSGKELLDVLSHGELSAIAAVLVAGAMGELFAGSREDKTPRQKTIDVLLGFANLSVFSANVIAYSHAVALPERTSAAMQQFSVQQSIVFFTGAVLVGGVSIIWVAS